MTEPMVAFVLARLDENAAPTAVEAWHEPWCLDKSGGLNSDGTCFYCGAKSDPDNVRLVPQSDRVLRDVESKRAIVAAYLPPGEDPHPGYPCTNDIKGDPDGEYYSSFEDSCMWHIEANKRRFHGDWILRLLAAPFDNHPDYLREWKP